MKKFLKALTIAIISPLILVGISFFLFALLLSTAFNDQYSDFDSEEDENLA